MMGRKLSYGSFKAMQVRVQCYSGYKADQRPVRFELGTRSLEIRELLDQWYSPTGSYFRVLADDGNLYVLGHDWEFEQDRWTLEAFRNPSVRR